MAFKLTVLTLCCLGLLTARPALGITDTDLLNFITNIECIEAEYYSTAINGYGLNSTTLGNGPPAVGGVKANLSPDLIKIATELANDEINHVTDLRARLGGSAVPCPKMDIGAAFSSIAAKALGIAGFFPYNTDLNFLLGAFFFEDVGVTGLHGALPKLTDRNNLELIASIAPVEAYHAAILRTLLYTRGLEMVTPYDIRVFDFVQGLSDFRNRAGGGKDQGVVVPKADGRNTSYPFANLVPQDGLGKAFERTPDEVLAVFYGGSAKQPGALFPSGLNGNINGTVAAS